MFNYQAKLRMFIVWQCCSMSSREHTTIIHNNSLLQNVLKFVFYLNENPIQISVCASRYAEMLWRRPDIVPLPGLLALRKLTLISTLILHLNLLSGRYSILAHNKTLSLGQVGVAGTRRYSLTPCVCFTALSRLLLAVECLR